MLVDGTLAATWRADVTDGVRVMQMGLYRALSDEELGEVEGEADRLLGFLSDGGERRLSFIDLGEVA